MNKYLFILFAACLILSQISCEKTTTQTPITIKLTDLTKSSSSGNIMVLDSSIIISNMSNLIIDGENKTYQFSNWTSSIQILNSQNITLKNFNVDYNPIPHSEGLILSRTNNTIQVKLLNGIPFDHAIYSQDITLYGLWRTADFKLVPGISNITTIKNSTTTLVSDSVYNITIPNLPAAILAGMYFIKDPSNGTDWGATIQLSRSDNIILQNISIFASTGAAINGILCSNISFDSCRDIPKPNTNRIFASNRDGINFNNPVSNYDIGPFITNCTIQDCGDDGINIHKNSWYSEVTDVNYIPVKLGAITTNNYVGRSIGQVGDTIEMLDSNGTVLNTENPLIIRDIVKQSDGVTYYVFLKTPFTSLPSKNNFFTNISSGNNSALWTTVSGTTIIRSRRIGILMLNTKSNIINNYSTQNPSSGLYISNLDVSGGPIKSLSAPCKSNYLNNNVPNDNNIQTNANLTTNLPQLIQLQCPK